MEIISANALISINSTFFVQLISFLLFMYVLNKIMVSPLRKISIKRDNHINNIQDRINNDKEKLEAISLEFKKKKTNLIERSLLETSEMKNIAQTKSVEIFTRAKNEITNLRQISDRELSKHIAELRTVLNEDVNSIVELLVEKIIDRRLAK